MIERAAALTALATLFVALPAAHAGRGTPCTDCESCTAALAQPGAEVALDAPVEATGACVVIRGAGATFDGGRHPIKGAGPAVRVEADDVFVRHLRVEGGQTAVALAGARATLLDVQSRGAAVGVAVERAEGARVVRSTFEGGRVGVQLGALAAGSTPACAPGAGFASPGVVLSRVEVTGAQIGVAACDAVPVLAHTTLRSNQVGLLQGQPGASAAPTDPCVCDPSLDDVRPATTLLYSSGCGGCEIHEGFLPDVRARGHDVRLRLTGRENATATAAYDAYTRRCAPEVMDAIGIPGCVPNYACVASGEAAKRRGDDDQLVVDHSLNSADDVSEFAAKCAAAAMADFGGKRCTEHQIYGSTICGNARDLVAARPLTGRANRCAGADGLDCAPCDGAAAAPPPPTAPTAPEPFPAAPAAPPTPAAPAAPDPFPAAPAAPTAPTAPDPFPAAPADGDTVADAPAAPADEAAAVAADDDSGSDMPWLPLVTLPLGALIGLLIRRAG